MPALTQKDLKIQSSIPIADIEEFHMEIRKNTHAEFYMEGAVSEEEGKDAVLQPLSETTIRIKGKITQSNVLWARIMSDDIIAYPHLWKAIVSPERTILSIL